jgi:dimethylargininase
MARPSCDASGRRIHQLAPPHALTSRGFENRIVGAMSDSPTALAREVSPTLGDCELTFLDREPIDLERAAAQHRAYCELLAELGLRVVVLPAEPDLPDAVFVEDTSVALDEVAVVTLPGAASRRPEVVSMAAALRRYRPVEYMTGPGTLDGGDVMRVARTLYVGRTARTTDDGIADLRALVEPRGYEVVPVRVDGCLHMKSGCSYLGRGAVLANPAWVDASSFRDVEVIDVPESEPWAANTVAVRDTVVVSSAFPETRRLLEARGFAVRALDVSELHKAEGGLSCLSVLLD